MLAIRTFDSVLLFSIIAVHFVNSAITFNAPRSKNNIFFNKLLTQSNTDQILLTINFKTHSHDHLTKLTELPNLTEYFLNYGVKIEIANSNRSNVYSQIPIWFLNQLKHRHKSGIVGALTASDNELSILKKSVSYSVDRGNQRNWFEQIDILIKWLTFEKEPMRINFGGLYFDEDEQWLQNGNNLNIFDRFDEIIGYLAKCLKHAGLLERVNIILIPENSDLKIPMILARGPVFKKRFVVEKSNGIEFNEIYPLMCYILDLNPTLYNQTLKNIRLVIDEIFSQTRLALKEKVNFAYYVSFILPKYERFQWDLDHSKSQETKGYLSKFYSELGWKEGLRSMKNEVYVVMLLVILLFFILLVQLKTYRHSSVDEK